MYKIAYNGISFKLKGLVGTCIVIEEKKKKSEIAKKFEDCRNIIQLEISALGETIVVAIMCTISYIKV